LTTGRNDSRPAGFSLLELILVMMIMCMALAAAAPSLRGFFASRQTWDAAGQIVALAHYARSQAAAEGRTYRLNVDRHRGAYWLTAQTPTGYESPAREFGRVFKAPAGATISWESAGPDAAMRDWIAFYPDGRSEAVRLRLTGQQGEAVDVVCRSPAEPFEAVRAGQEQTP
jgi:type II secretion system protein H